MAERSTYPHLMLLGDAGTGKTCLLKQYTDKTFLKEPPASTGLDHKRIKYKNSLDEIVDIKVWDPVCNSRMISVIQTFFKTNNGYLLVFDITNPESFEGVKKYLQLIAKHGDAETPKLLVGNKLDLEHLRKVKQEDAMTFAAENEMEYIEVSAKNKEKVETIFEKILESTYQYFLKSGKKDIKSFMLRADGGK